MSTKENVTIRLMNKEAWKKLKIMAIKDNMTIADKLRELIEKTRQPK